MRTKVTYYYGRVYTLVGLRMIDTSRLRVRQTHSLAGGLFLQNNFKYSWKVFSSRLLSFKSYILFELFYTTNLLKF